MDRTQSPARRPWPPPRRPWVLHQRWDDLLFMHWPVTLDTLRPRVPPNLLIETFHGQAWLGIVPFQMRDVRPRLMPPAPLYSHFPELNVRTYVTVDGKPGVFFLSLDAANPLAVAVARTGAHLAYFRADMSVHQDGDTIHYASHRTHLGAPPADLEISYRPTGSPSIAPPGSLADWLTARYCLYAADRQGRLVRVEIDHAPWPLQHAEATISVNTMAASHRIPLPVGPPLLHFARQMSVRTWWPNSVPAPADHGTVTMGSPPMRPGTGGYDANAG